LNNTCIISNCRLYSDPSEKPVVHILIRDGIIETISTSRLERTDIPVVDAGGRLVAPGFIDVHIQGAGGSDVLDNSSEALQTIATTLAATGTTGYLGTTVVKPEWGNAHLKLARENTGKDLGGAVLLGVHIEGPFINIKKKGGLAADAIYASSPEALDEILDVTGDSLKMMTIAPELPGNLDIIRSLVRHNVVPAFAHSDATFEETLKGFDAGIRHVTHIFNAMPPLHHRNPGPLTAIFTHPTVTAQIISDGHHIHPRIVGLTARILGTSRCVCITDGVQALGLPEGRFIYNGREYESKNGAAKYDDGTLIGSTMSLGNIAIQFKEFTHCSLREAIDTVTINPARVLGIDTRKGSVDEGKDADLVLLDNDYSIYKTFAGGKEVYGKE
jgi:N-acetylglucosamine-6-phosphate deacetylase